MAMKIMHDASAALAVNELNKNANNLQKDLKKVASGMRINSAADDASGYAIGERMAVRLRALNQDIINAQTGSDLIRVAEGGVQSVIEELRTLKELALNSINDHNSDLDRATLQKEFEQRTANIDNIANETEYNGRILLNGDYRRKFLGTSTIPDGRNVLSTNTVSSTTTSAPVTSSSTKTSVQTSGPVTKTTRSTTTTTSATKPTEGTTEGTPTSTTTTSNSSSVTGPTTSVTSNTVTVDTQTTDNGDGTFTEVKKDVTTQSTTKTIITTDTETTTTITTKVSTIVSAKENSSSSGLPVRPGTSEAGVTPATPGSQDNPIIISAGDYTISTDGVYKLGTGYKGNITITAQNVELSQTDSEVHDTYISCSNANSNLWLNGIKIYNRFQSTTEPFVEKSIIKFSGTGNTLQLIGSSSLQNPKSQTKATINVGSGLTINDGDSTGYLNVTQTGLLDSAFNSFAYGAAIGSDEGENSNGYIIINSGNVKAGCNLIDATTPNNENLGGGTYGAAIGSGKNASIGMIAINGGTVNAIGQYSAAIGSGYHGTVNGNVVVRAGTVQAQTKSVLGGSPKVIIRHSSGAAIGSGESGIVSGSIIIKGGNVTAISEGTGAAIGVGGYDSSESSVNNIIIKNCAVHASSQCAAAIGYSTIDQDTSTMINYGNVNSALQSRGLTPSKVGEYETLNEKGYGNTTGTLEMGGTVVTPPKSNGKFPSVYGGTYTESVSVSGYDYTNGKSKYGNLKFDHVYDRDISDTTGADAPDGDTGDPTDASLGGYTVTTETITTTTTTITTKETKTTDYETVTDTITGTTTTVYEPAEEIVERYKNPLIIHTGTKANQHLRIFIEDMRPEALGIDKAKINPQDAAIESLAIIDGAIDYAIEQATHLGAYISRLGHTENTLTADSENTQTSESTIRDADMAMEMLQYTKDNILAQTAQAMLAQANQNASSVLSLLQ